MTTIAIYGGSFDPPHVAHFLVASWVASSCSVDRVLLVPTAQHSLGKQARASFEHRVALCERLAARIPGCEVSDVEARLTRPSRTLTMLEALRDVHPEARFRLVVGADIAAETHLWHRWDEIVRLAEPLWVGRVGYPPPPGAVVEFPAVSSTAVREILASGGDPGPMLTDEVRAYVAEHGLYRAPG